MEEKQKFRPWTRNEEMYLVANKEEPNCLLAEKLGRTVGAIERKKTLLGISRKQLNREEKEAIFRPLYDQGMNDERISERTGHSTSTVHAWRKTNGLPANGYNDLSRRIATRVKKTRRSRKKQREIECKKRIMEVEDRPNCIDVKTSAQIDTRRGRLYTEEQDEWLKAILSFRGKFGRPPTEVEAFRIAISLGYRKQGGDNEQQSIEREVHRGRGKKCAENGR